MEYPGRCFLFSSVSHRERGGEHLCGVCACQGRVISHGAHEDSAGRQVGSCLVGPGGDDALLAGIPGYAGRLSHPAVYRTVPAGGPPFPGMGPPYLPGYVGSAAAPSPLFILSPYAA